MKIVRRFFLLSALSFLVLTLIVTFVPTAGAGTPFYLTIERSYRPDERPVVRLDYSNTKTPILFRVLKPKNVERFLDGQLNLSRSYEEPISQLNLGHYFAKGINRVRSPLESFRRVLNERFRKEFKGDSFEGSLFQHSKPLAAVPAEISQGIPKGFELVREFVVDTQRGGETTQELGWWFWGTTWDEWRYRVRSVELDPLAQDGLYLVQAVQGKDEGQALLQVSGVSLQVQQSTAQLIVRAINRSQQPLSGLNVSIRDGRGKWNVLPGKTGADGTLVYSGAQGPLDGKLVVMARDGNEHMAFVETDFLPTSVAGTDVFLTTDRPIFKPGDDFRFKGIIRRATNGQLTIPDLGDAKALVRVFGTDGIETELSSELPLTSAGTFAGSFTLPDYQAPGLYRVIAEVGGKPYSGEFRVRDYIKPVFYLEITEKSPTVKAGEPFSFKFRARRYAGGVPKDLKYEFFIYRKKFELPTWIVESGGGLDAGADYFGEVRSTSALAQPQRVYSSIEARTAEDDSVSAMNPWETAAEVDPSGEQVVEVTVPEIKRSGVADGAREEWIYTIVVRARDAAGAQAVTSENVYMTFAEAFPMLQFVRPIADIGQPIETLVRTTYADGAFAPQGEGVIEPNLERADGTSVALTPIPFKTNERGVTKISIPPSSIAGRLVAKAKLSSVRQRAINPSSESDPQTAIVAGADTAGVIRNRELALFTENTVLEVGQKQRVLALLPVGWGDNEQGTIWQTIAGDKVHAATSRTLKGRTAWLEVDPKSEYGTGFYQIVSVPVAGGKYAEAKLGFRVVPKAKQLVVEVLPSADVTEPLKPFRVRFQVKDSTGVGVANAELGVSVVDRAVYDVQAEFRPKAFDFFYPLPRLNLASFYSDELQGYGYGDVLKQPNFSLAALKSQSKPTKRAMRDTAGWFPHVVTDERGEAEISVDMPANVTEWLITAVVADANGRVGEGRGQFRSASEISVEGLTPQFMREGDEAVFKLRTMNHLQQPEKLEAVVRSESGLERIGEVSSNEVLEVPAGGEVTTALRFRQTAASGTGVVEFALKGRSDLKTGGAESFEVKANPAVVDQRVYDVGLGNDLLSPQFPSEGKIKEIRVQVSSGLLGAALGAADQLVVYPFGCTEQLSHTIVPNLVLMDVIQRAGISNEQLGPLKTSLLRAKLNAAQGIQKLLANQKSDGGFSLWSSEPDSSVSISIVAAEALRYASELQVPGAEAALERLKQYLIRQKLSFGATDSIAVGYMLANIAELKLWDAPDEDFAAYIKRSLELPAAGSVDRYVYALRILKAYESMSWHSLHHLLNVPESLEAIAEKLKSVEIDPASMLRLVSARDRGEFGFPIGEAAMLATVARGFSQAGLLTPELRSQLVKQLLMLNADGMWGSTFDASQVIFNLRELIADEAKEQKTRSALAFESSDGTKLGEVAPIPGGYFARLPVDLDVKAASNFRLNGLLPEETRTVTFTVETPFRALQPSNQGISISRSLFRREGKRMVPLSTAARAGEPIYSVVSVTRATKKSGTQISPSSFVVLEDGLPSLVEAAENDREYLADVNAPVAEDSYWSSVKETLRYPERVTRVLRLLPGATYRSYQVWLPTTSGRASLPPARAYDMYTSEIFGSTSAGELIVE